MNGSGELLYYCDRCDKLLHKDGLLTYTEYGEFWGSPYSETLQLCPFCKGEIIKLTKICSCCGEYITGEYILTENEEYYCGNCYKKGDVTKDDINI